MVDDDGGHCTEGLWGTRVVDDCDCDVGDEGGSEDAVDGSDREEEEEGEGEKEEETLPWH